MESVRGKTFETLNPLALDERKTRSVQLKPLKAHFNKNDGEYFDILKDKNLIKERDKDIQELIDSKQLSNTTFVIEIDDFKELDSFITLLDPATPKDITIYNTEVFPNISTITEKPCLMVKAFKFSFSGDEVQEQAAYEKHQMFSSQLNEVYAQAVKYFKNALYEEKEVFYTPKPVPKDKSLKKKLKSDILKPYNSLQSNSKPYDKKVVITSFKVLFNIDEKGEVHVCIYCMCWKANNDCLIHHNEELDYLEKEEVIRETYDVGDLDKSHDKDTREPFIIRKNKFFGCF